MFNGSEDSTIEKNHHLEFSLKAFSALTPIIQKFDHLLKKLPAFHCLLEDLHFWFEFKPNVIH